jgi:soluble lytic murein transglycosylase-like protein
MYTLALTVTGQAAQAKMPQAPDSHCEAAIGAAARTARVPGDLMAAIGLVETGRQDPVSGIWRPWPWAINAEGKGLFFGSKSEAIAAVRNLQAAGVRSIDVGCMQVNLMHHPDAFATLDEAFDPKRNASYAGRFLNELFQRSGDWMTAAGWYHSSTAGLAAEYVKKVAAILPGAKLSLARGESMSMNFKDATPILDRDGMFLPSVRLTPSGLVPSRTTNRYLNARGKPSFRFAG